VVQLKVTVGRKLGIKQRHFGSGAKTSNNAFAPDCRCKVFCEPGVGVEVGVGGGLS